MSEVKTIKGGIREFLRRQSEICGITEIQPGKPDPFLAEFLDAFDKRSSQPLRFHWFDRKAGLWRDQDGIPLPMEACSPCKGKKKPKKGRK